MLFGELQRPGLGVWLLGLAATFTVFFLCAPMVIVLLVSIGSNDLAQFPPNEFSLHWYQEVFRNPAWLRGFGLSAYIAAVAVALSLLMGVPAAMGLVRHRFRGKLLLCSVILSPMIVPTIISAVAIYFFFGWLNLVGSPTAIGAGHAVLAVPMVVIILCAALQGLDEQYEMAALSMGAGRLYILRRIVLPLIMPALVSAIVIAFLTSFDELLLPLFLTAPGKPTLTVMVWNRLILDVDPTVTAVSALTILFTLSLLGIVAFLSQRSRVSSTSDENRL